MRISTSASARARAVLTLLIDREFSLGDEICHEREQRVREALLRERGLELLRLEAILHPMADPRRVVARWRARLGRDDAHGPRRALARAHHQRTRGRTGANVTERRENSHQLFTPRNDRV